MRERLTSRRSRTTKATATLALTFALFAGGCGSDGATNDSSYINGVDIAANLKQNMSDTNGIPLQSVDCPNERLAIGESVDCSVVFGDGSTKGITATFEGYNGGQPKINVGLQ